MGLGRTLVSVSDPQGGGERLKLWGSNIFWSFGEPNMNFKKHIYAQSVFAPEAPKGQLDG